VSLDLIGLPQLRYIGERNYSSEQSSLQSGQVHTPVTLLPVDFKEVVGKCLLLPQIAHGCFRPPSRCVVSAASDATDIWSTSSSQSSRPATWSHRKEVRWFKRQSFLLVSRLCLARLSAGKPTSRRSFLVSLSPFRSVPEGKFDWNPQRLSFTLFLNHNSLSTS